jgi:glucose-6-phosphate dehydrogenase assembly protein OpcA
VSADSERIHIFQRGESIAVSPSRIEAELTVLWRQAAARAGEGKGAVTRACLWNLVVRAAAGEEGLAKAKQIVDELSRVVPARAIVLSTDPGAAEEALSASVEANWRPGNGHTLSGSDEVTLRASGAAVARLPSLVRALLVTDAPTAILQLGPPDGAALRRDRLVAEVERLVIDTRRLVDERALGDIDRLAAALPELEIADLAWIGVRPLRGLVASLFDPPAADPRELSVVDRVEVTSGVVGTQTRALLTLGWLGARLGWRGYRGVEAVSSGDAGTRRWIAARPDGGEVELALHTRRGGVSHGVVAVTLQHGARRFTVERGEALIECRSPDRPPRCQPMRRHSDADLVVRSLSARGRDPQYRDALTEAVHLIDTQPSHHA